MDTRNILTQYFSSLIKGRRYDCHSVIEKAICEGASVKDVYDKVFYPSMVRIGEMWQENQISVAQEHLATAITQSIISSLYYRIFEGKPLENKGKIIIACIGNELHELGSRMLADLLEMDGFDVKYLGANTPNYSIIKIVDEEKPLIVGISCTMSFNVNGVRELIAMIKTGETKDVSIFAGGRAFDVDRKLVGYVGADYYESKFDKTIELMNYVSGEKL